MAWTTPGIDFLAQKLLFPASLNYGALRVSLHFLKYPVPEWVLIPISVLVIPLRSAATIAYRRRKYRLEAEARGARLAPILEYSPSLGNTKLIEYMTTIWKTGYPGDGFWGFIKQFGTFFNINPVFTDVIFSLEPEHIKRVLATDFDCFGKGERHIEALQGVLGSGVFSSDGEMWKFHRTMARPFFSRDRVTDLERFDKHIQEAIALMKQRISAGYAVDFQDLIQRTTMALATEFLFGAAVNSLQISVEDLPQPFNHPDYQASVQAFSKNPANEFSDAFLRAQTVAAERDRAGWVWPLTELFEDRLKNDMKIIAATSTFLFYLLSQHPEVYSRLRAEILEKVGSTKRPTYEDIKELKYLRAVINETLRVLPPVPWDVRHCKNGAILPSPNPKEKPIYVPPEASVVYGILMMGTSEDLWGPDAAEFDPDRWIDERKQRYIANPFIFIPFNAGPRICLGQQLAYNEMSLIIIRFMQAFSSFTLDETAFPPEGRVPEEWASGEGRKAKERFRPKVVLTMSSEGGMWFKAKLGEDH
ncbi:hypothetical protein MD484_g3285, partial [Candolleomyces efflorescens]